MNNLRHYANYRQQEFIILGFNAADGGCLLCNVTALPVGEQQQLRMIASSVVAQNTYYLIPLLDAYSNEFDSIGSRTTGTSAGNFAIAGPLWKAPR